MRLVETDQKGAHLNHGEDNADGTENGLGWCYTAELLRKIHSFYGYVQRGDSNILTSLGLCIHGRYSWRVEESGVARRL